MNSLYPTTRVDSCPPKISLILLRYMIIGLIGTLPLYAQFTFDSGSTGADGALDLSSEPSGTTLIFNPLDFDPPLDTDGDGVYNFTTITIPQGVTVRFPGISLGAIYWLATGGVTIDGTLDLSGEDGQVFSAENNRPATPGAGGFPGGIGRTQFNLAQPGGGPGGGRVTSNDGGGGSYATTGGGGSGIGGEVYGNGFLIPLIGGSGGAGNNLDFGGFSGSGGSGGAGGGAILIASSQFIAINGGINGNGGQRGSGTNNATKTHGGGGSGGAVRLLAPTISGAGSITAVGGSNQSFGGAGRIRFESISHQYTGVIQGVSTFATLVQNTTILPSADTTALLITSISGQTLPATVKGSFISPDLTLTEPGNVTFDIQARHIPLGTVVKVEIYNETDGLIAVDSTPLEGVLAESTATATTAVPSGLSRVHVRAKWTP